MRPNRKQIVCYCCSINLNTQQVLKTTNWKYSLLDSLL